MWWRVLLLKLHAHAVLKIPLLPDPREGGSEGEGGGAITFMQVCSNAAARALTFSFQFPARFFPSRELLHMMTVLRASRLHKRASSGRYFPRASSQKIKSNGKINKQKNKKRECVRACTRVLMRRVPLRLRCLLLWTGTPPRSRSLHCWHSAVDVTPFPHSQHRQRGSAVRRRRRQARASRKEWTQLRLENRTGHAPWTGSVPPLLLPFTTRTWRWKHDAQHFTHNQQLSFFTE